MQKKLRVPPILILILALCSHLCAQQTSTIHVNKPLITIFGPNAQGMTYITGIPNAIQSDRPFTTRVLNLDTNQQTAVIVNEDGSFNVEIAAAAGQRVRILARNDQRRQSYGTFTVPAAQPADPNPPTDQPQQPQNQIPTPIEPTAPLAPMEPIQPVQPTAAANDQPGRMTVTIIVIDSYTGQVLAADTTSGLARTNSTAPDDKQQAAQQILQRCLSVAQNQMRPLSAQTPPSAQSADTPAAPSNQ